MSQSDHNQRLWPPSPQMRRSYSDSYDLSQSSAPYHPPQVIYPSGVVATQPVISPTTQWLGTYYSPTPSFPPISPPINQQPTGFIPYNGGHQRAAFLDYHPLNANPAGTTINTNHVWVTRREPGPSFNERVQMQMEAYCQQQQYVNASQFAAQHRVSENESEARFVLLESAIKTHQAEMAKLENKVHSLNGTIENMKSTHQIDINRLEAKHKKEIDAFTYQLTSLIDELNALKQFVLTDDVYALIWIRFRALLDKVLEILYFMVFGKNSSDSRLQEAKSWWATLNPPSYRCPEVPDKRDERTIAKDHIDLDEYRYNEIQKILKEKGLSDKPAYQALIAAGSLEYLSQSQLEIREKANQGAHDLIGMERFHSLLDKAQSEGEKSKICPPNHINSLRGFIKFVETMERDIKAAAPPSATSTASGITIETESTTNTTTRIHMGPATDML